MTYLDGKKTDNTTEAISATDYAILTGAYMHSYIDVGIDWQDYFKTVWETARNGRPATRVCLRSSFGSDMISFIDSAGYNTADFGHYMSFGLCPSLHYDISSNTSEQGSSRLLKEKKNRENDRHLEQFDIRKVKDRKGRTLYHTLQIGEYPKTKVDKELSEMLESLYNGGEIKEGLVCTGRWYSGNGQKKTSSGYSNNKDYAGKHNPEFEYQGNRYVRMVPYSSKENQTDDISLANQEEIRWVKVEPISFKIRNWDEMPKSINPYGNGKAKYFDLKAEEAIVSNIPFYPNGGEKNSALWQNSTIRGFLNGIDVRNIQSNGNKKYGASRGGNFTGKCNFLNEAFNLSREPMLEYTIPSSETEIPDDAFNGCVTLKKVIMHPGIQSIGKRAFDGLQFKYTYKTKTGELVLSQELPKNKNEYTDVVELDKILEAFGGFNHGFDYSIILQHNKLVEIMNLSNDLRKNKFSIPYIYGLELVNNEKATTFCKNTDFRFFKNELPQINEMLLGFSEKEKLNFYKFANSLGCFSKDKILDKNGKETEVPIAQKASSLLAQLIKTKEMRLR